MDVEAHIKSRLAGRHVTAGQGRASYGALLYPMGSTVGQFRRHGFDQIGVAEIFKKTPCAAGLKPAGRDVAKDMLEVASIPSPMKTLLDRGALCGDFLTAAERTVAENLKAVKRNSHQDADRYAGRPITVTGGADDTGAWILNLKLTDKELAVRQTKRKLRATNHSSGALWKDAQQVGAVVDGGAIHPRRAHEKRCYADI